jgi:hypothetical protein
VWGEGVCVGGGAGLSLLKYVSRSASVVLTYLP